MTVNIWAIYTDGYCNGSRDRHVLDTFDTREEARSAAVVAAEMEDGSVYIKGFESEEEVKAFNIDAFAKSNNDPLERMKDTRDYYSDVAS